MFYSGCVAKGFSWIFSLCDFRRHFGVTAVFFCVLLIISPVTAVKHRSISQRGCGAQLWSGKLGEGTVLFCPRDPLAVSWNVIPRLDKNDVLAFTDLKGNYKVVGTGASATTYMTHIKSFDKTSVVKVFQASTSDWEFEREVWMSFALNGSGVTPDFYGLLEYPDHPNVKAFVSRYIGNTEAEKGILTMEKLLETDTMDTRNTIGINQWLHLCMKLANKVNNLHGRGYFHGDIRLDNVLLEEMESGVYEPYFVDLGQTSQVDMPYRYLMSEGFRNFILDNHEYIAPELTQGGYFSTKSDIFALGYILKEILLQKKLLLLQDIVDTCMDRDPDMRPNALDVSRRLGHLLEEY